MSKLSTFIFIICLLCFAFVAHAQKHDKPQDTTGENQLSNSLPYYKFLEHVFKTDKIQDGIEGTTGNHKHCYCFFAQDTVDHKQGIVYISNYSYQADSTIWYFGDGDSSKMSMPTHVYAASKKYLLCLIIACNGGHYAWYCDSISDTGVNKFRSQQSVGFTLKVVAAGTATVNIQSSVLKTYPNPVTNTFNITMPDGCPNGTVILRNTLGQQILSYFVNNMHINTLNIETFPPGIYLVELNTPKGKYFSHLIKQ